MSPDQIRLYAAELYGHDLSEARAAELAEELSALVGNAGFDALLPGFEDTPDRFAVALAEAARIGVVER